MAREKPTPRERRLKLAEVFTRKVGIKEARRIRGRKQKEEGLWFGLSVFGIVGWSVVIPTLIGTAVGLWIDGQLAEPFFLDADAARLGCGARDASMRGTG